MDMKPKILKKYMLFLYDMYEPSGGWGDFVGSFATVEWAETHIKDRYIGMEGCSDCYDIVDRVTGEYAESGFVKNLCAVDDERMKTEYFDLGKEANVTKITGEGGK